MDAEHTVAAIEALQAATGAEDTSEVVEAVGLAFRTGYRAGIARGDTDLVSFNLGMLAGLLGFFCARDDARRKVCDPDTALQTVLAQIASQEGA